MNKIKRKWSQTGYLTRKFNEASNSPQSQNEEEPTTKRKKFNENNASNINNKVNIYNKLQIFNKKKKGEKIGCKTKKFRKNCDFIHRTEQQIAGTKQHPATGNEGKFVKI